MSRRRTRSHSRVRGALSSLLLLGILAGGGTAIYKWQFADSSAAESATLSVRYRTDTPASADVAKPWLEVKNNSGKTVELSDVTLRYYFTADDASAYGSNCVQTSLGCTSLTQRIKKIDAPAGATSTADHYLEVGFTAAAGSLAPGGTSEGIGLQLYRLDREKLDQADDRSFNAEYSHYTPSKLVTAYLRGTLAWGEEPDGATPAPPAQDSPSPAAGPAVAAPRDGVLFDDFNYTGPDDPALSANGWQIRDSAGGPGVRDSWTKSGVSFPVPSSGLPSDESSSSESGETGETDREEAGAGGQGGQGGQALQLRASTDGTKGGTRQVELQSSDPVFFTGTLAARVYLTDKPTSGLDGDHISQSFFTISPDHTSTKYSELDYEYMPNGGWGAPGPRLDTTSWRNSQKGDRVTSASTKSLEGWHTMVITAVDGKATYSIDGRKLFTSGSRHFPRESMGIRFSSWFIDLPFQGERRTWDMQVDWLYYQADKAVSLEDVHKAVTGFAADGTGYVNTLPKP
ncbi:cellulose binding domain-containing protein [Streptomyces sp. PR69]|uniref:cellulose binding domain-containing protein n=1 Tax=Streptomyces sp. PR69 TaxID=2984950 RepID=UPI002264B332|nr:cellulose binding domain-containing protein [Streptomyces sp. PR69]